MPATFKMVHDQLREAWEENARLREALAPFAEIGRGLYEANQRSDQSALIGASARFLKLDPLVGQHFVNAYTAMMDGKR